MATTIEKPNEQADDEIRSASPEAPKAAPGQTLTLGLIFGVVFGFLLQKGGVAKYHVLEGQLLLADFTVVKVMLSAVVIGMLGVHFMHRLGLVELHIKPTRYASNAIGGLVFGTGFALSAYCPGTGAAALGQGNFDALAMVLGMVGGSYLFAEASGWVSKKVDPIGDRGKITLHDWLPLNRTVVVISAATLLTCVLITIGFLTVR